MAFNPFAPQSTFQSTPRSTSPQFTPIYSPPPSSSSPIATVTITATNANLPVESTVSPTETITGPSAPNRSNHSSVSVVVIFGIMIGLIVVGGCITLLVTQRKFSKKKLRTSHIQQENVPSTEKDGDNASREITVHQIKINTISHPLNIPPPPLHRPPTQRPPPQRPSRPPSQRSSPSSPQRSPSQRSSPSSPQRSPSQRSSPSSPQRSPSQRSSPSSPQRSPSQRSSPSSPQRSPPSLSPQLPPSLSQRLLPQLPPSPPEGPLLVLPNSPSLTESSYSTGPEYDPIYTNPNQSSSQPGTRITASNSGYNVIDIDFPDSIFIDEPVEPS